MAFHQGRSSVCVAIFRGMEMRQAVQNARVRRRVEGLPEIPGRRGAFLAARADRGSQGEDIAPLAVAGGRGKLGSVLIKQALCAVQGVELQ